eukprot:TRINITY_DN509_c0_g1_i3.p2 TRINITY_DN509_c0_g1~~TRINITY_DN509_c0_g1_i3.p2  ORF type:complete len:240 (+),score=50.06 TRINITY_DN509_c0_g1_i3:475-1194(+)
MASGRRYKHQPGDGDGGAGSTLLPPNMAMAAMGGRKLATPAPRMELSSPAPPLGLRLTSDVSKAAMVFLSHVRRTFARAPVDYTGELVRLLDDISIVTRSVASYVAESSASVAYGSVGDASTLSSDFSTTKMYKSLTHDGYACIILSRDREMPLTFPEDAPTACTWCASRRWTLISSMLANSPCVARRGAFTSAAAPPPCPAATLTCSKRRATRLPPATASTRRQRRCTTRWARACTRL